MNGPTAPEWGVVYPSGAVVDHGGDRESAQTAAREGRLLGLDMHAVTRKITPWVIRDRGAR